MPNDATTDTGASNEQGEPKSEPKSEPQSGPRTIGKVTDAQAIKINAIQGQTRASAMELLKLRLQEQELIDRCKVLNNQFKAVLEEIRVENGLKEDDEWHIATDGGDIIVDKTA